MKRTVALTALLLAGCSAGSAASTSSPSQSALTAPATVSAPATASAPAAAATPTGAAQKAVPIEKSPPGDIPDNLAFIAYANTAGHYSFTHPEGWSQTVRGTTVMYTDKLNGVQVMPGSSAAPLTVESVKRQDVPLLAASQAAFELRGVSAVAMPGGSGVKIVYRRNSAPDDVTGRQYRDEVDRYQLVSHGRQVVMELFGPIGADNVDAYRTMVQSLRLA